MILSLVMDEIESFDINTELDFIVAEEMLKRGLINWIKPVHV